MRRRRTAEDEKPSVPRSRDAAGKSARATCGARQSGSIFEGVQHAGMPMVESAVPALAGTCGRRRNKRPPEWGRGTLDHGIDALVNLSWISLTTYLRH